MIADICFLVHYPTNHLKNTQSLALRACMWRNSLLYFDNKTGVDVLSIQGTIRVDASEYSFYEPEISYLRFYASNILHRRSLFAKKQPLF